MPIADMWTRTYELWTDGPLTRHIYYWLGADNESPYLAIGPRKNLHPLYSYTPSPVVTPRVIQYAAPCLLDSFPVGHMYRRLTTGPSVDADPDYPSWDFSAYAVEEVLLVCNAQVDKGVVTDDNGVPLAWEFGGDDFSTPFPSWVFQFQPTHFRVNLTGVASGQLVCPLLSHEQDDLDAASLERPELNHVYTSQGEYIWSNGGPNITRHSLMSTAAAPGFETVSTTVCRDTSNGDLVGGMGSVWNDKPLIWAYDDSYWYTTQYIITWHHANRPTLRILGWSKESLPYGTPEGTWSLIHFGIYGVQYEDINFSATVAATGLDWRLLSFDDSLDFNAHPPPDGTTCTKVYCAIYGEEGVSVLEGPEAVAFADGGTRSGLGGSVYIPGRVMKIGNITDAGVAT